MCEYLKLKTKNWNLKSQHEASRIWKFQNWNVWIGSVNIESWKLKIKNWNLFVKCLEGIKNFEKWNIWILKIKNWNVWILKIESWRLKCLNTKNWSV
jgi:hypothetical protein